jgi:hypothetical protein
MDRGECMDYPKTEIASSLTNHKDKQHKNETRNPFCSCDCCGQIFYPNFQLEKIAAKKVLEKTKQQFFYRNITLSSDFFGNIWQPPKYS